MTLTRKACLEVGCCSFEGYSDEASAGTGPEIKSTSVVGTQLCRKGEPGGSFPADPPVGKVYAWEEFQVQVLSVTRGVPAWTQYAGIDYRWEIPVTFEFRVTSTCDDCDSPTTVDITHTQEFQIECGRDNANEFTFSHQAAFDSFGTLCGSNAASAAAAWINGTSRTEQTVQSSAISGKGCAAYDQVVFTINVPITGVIPGIGSPPYPCQDVSLFNFPASTSNGACVLTMEWSLLSP
ncbi:MAG: hypothetical protein GY878_18435 [Fuerstiella sp.]|nr:hypothetical protein [Fuerstiella sp.]